ncbi:hypothetical protein [Paenibacillus contaminans]|uniref:Transposase (putative) YhgA-like domain-containing protein n=1 Tax=Paenibacillus contaminans TaxID=450362 RepID=A0A329MPH5_9BACL|nr:hypothetical protein [Paenibacillus contaminans]RAV21819.1 hypothetical protein DQG23_07105 [Paenibacillus contaminans]
MREKRGRNKSAEKTATNHDEAFKKLLQTFFKEFIFTSDDLKEETDTLTMVIPEHDILRFQFLTVELRSKHWRAFIGSDNPVAAALLVKMDYNKKERREVRIAYLRMLLRLQATLDNARMALIMSVADLYFKPSEGEEEAVMKLLREQYPEEGERLMELMPAWQRWGYEKGIEEGIEKGREEIIRKLLDKGFSPEDVAKTVDMPIVDVRKLANP